MKKSDLKVLVEEVDKQIEAMEIYASNADWRIVIPDFADSVLKVLAHAVRMLFDELPKRPKTLGLMRVLKERLKI